MFSSFYTFALVATLTTSANMPAWQMDYRQAHDVAARDQKPLCVVIGNGSHGWDNVCDIADNSADTMRSAFVCCYVDKATPEGQKMAAEFALDGVGMIISDRTGAVQAYRHIGPLNSDEVQRAATRYSNPAFVVRTTETYTSTPQSAIMQASYQQPASSQQQGQAPTAPQQPVRSSCPNCPSGGCPNCR